MNRLADLRARGEDPNSAVGAELSQLSLPNTAFLALEGGQHGPEVIQAVLLGMAVETANLGYVRRQQQGKGTDTSQVCSRRIDSLSKLAAVVLELTKLGGDGIDLGSPKFQILLNLFVEQINEAALTTLPGDKATEVIGRFRKAVAGWEDRIGLR